MPAHDQFITPAIAQTGEYSAEEVDFLLEVLAPHSHIVEVGANIGSITLALAQAEHTIWALEPQPYLYKLLELSLRLNNLGRARVAVRPMAAGLVDGTILLPILDPNHPQNFGSVAADADWKTGVHTPICTLDRWCGYNTDKYTQLEYRVPALIKIDCEGTELNVLKGAHNTLETYKPLLYIEFAENRSAILQYLNGLGYAYVRHLPAHERTPNYLNTPLSEGRAFASDMLFAWHPSNPPQVEEGLGLRHLLTYAKDEEILGTGNTFTRVDPIF